MKEKEVPELKVIARIHSDFSGKFGIPRQSGLVEELESAVVFEPEYRREDALRGIEDFSHLWLIWGFHKAVRESWSPTVRPPRLGGNTRMGVFATRSPFRPNPIGLSSVKLLGVEHHPEYGHILRVAGADLMDVTPIFVLKPYLPSGGFAGHDGGKVLEVDFPPELQALVPPDKLAALTGVLAHDPRPAYQQDPERVYGMEFAGLNVRFSVRDEVLTVRQVEKLGE